MIRFRRTGTLAFLLWFWHADGHRIVIAEEPQRVSSTSEASPVRWTQPELRGMVVADIQAEILGGSPTIVRVEGDTLRWSPAWVLMPWSDPVQGKSRKPFNLEDWESKQEWTWFYEQQGAVEMIRRYRTKPSERAFWEPVLARVESVISQALAKRAEKGPLGNKERAAYERAIDASYAEAIRDYATRLGLKTERLPVRPAPMAQSGLPVTLRTANGNGTIMLASWLEWRLEVLHHGNREADSIFESYSQGEEVQLMGLYVYKIRDSSGQTSELRRRTFNKAGVVRLP